MNQELENSLKEARLYIGSAFGKEPTDKELLEVLESLLAERRLAEMKKRFMSWRPEYIRQVIAGLVGNVKDKGTARSN